MSDAFADLWNSSAPSKPTQSRTLGSQTPNTTAPKRQQPDVFALLSSSSSSSNPPSRPGTGFSQQQKSNQTPPSKPAVTNNSDDAFSGLFTSSSSSSLGGSSRLTMAQRAAEAEKQKLEALQRHQHAQQAAKSQSSSAWDGLDSLMSKSNHSTATAAFKPQDDDFGFEAFAQPVPTKPSTAPKQTRSLFDEDDLLGGFGASTKQPQAAAPVPQRTSQGWDSPPPRPDRTDSPGDFDFGDRENRDALLDDSSGEEDDILGALSKPVDPVSLNKKTRTAATIDAHTTSPPPRPASGARSKPSSRPVSPPPHILGQIVEMGFSIQQAKVALASTDTGLDVQAALETLLSNGAASSSRGHTPQPRGQSPQSPDYPASSQPPRSASRLMPGNQSRDSPSPSARGDGDVNLQDQADKIIAQASEIGLTMFSKASAFWKEGKDRVQKAYVERTATSGTSTPSGRPKWMQEARENDDWEDNNTPMKSTFADEPSRPSAEQARSAPPPKPKPQQSPQEQGHASRIANLFGDEEPVAYVSPFRRGKAKEQATALAASMSTPTPPPATPPKPAPPKPRQNVVSCPAAVLARSTQYKTRGSEQFKLGQYADAASSYSLGITALPEGHLSLVPLYNNRALARLKTGEYAGAIEDASVVVSLIGEGYHPAREDKVEKEDEGAGIDLGDGLVKAIKRRAEANEGRERWKEAEKDWEMLSKIDFAPSGLKNEAVRNAGRCRRTVTSLQETTSAAPTPAPKPKPAPPRPRPAVSVKPSQALKDLRNANEAAEAEDQQRHELKDGVDAKLTAWKGGKEANIRALLGSVDTVLWPELGFKKVGMHELVTPAQVKIRYTKVIARLHPDKLNTNNTTVEQRMIANAVFGALNEAWNSFKQ